VSKINWSYVLAILDLVLTVVGLVWILSGRITEGLLVFIYMEVRDVRLSTEGEDW